MAGACAAKIASCSLLMPAGSPGAVPGGAPLVTAASPSEGGILDGEDSGGLKNTGKGDPPTGVAFISTCS